MPPNSSASSIPIDSKLCTPIDAAFIVLSSLVLLMIFLWLTGRQIVGDIPAPIEKVVGSIWTKVIIGGGAAGMLALRKWLYEHTGPNYLIWIPGCTILWFLFFFATVKLLPASTPDSPSAITATVHFTLPSLAADKSKLASTEIKFAQISPRPDDPILLSPRSDENGGYSRFPLTIPPSTSGAFVAFVNHIVLDGHTANQGHDWEYQVCLEAPKSLPASTDPLDIYLACVADGSCSQASGHKNVISTCDAQDASLLGLPVVHAAEDKSPAREAGWVVPSLDTLQKQLPSHRGGYTRFDVDFTPTTALNNAARYYYSVHVNGTPTYIDGFLPERDTHPLIKGDNKFSFALENLNFRGEHDGYEQIDLTLTFLDKDSHPLNKLSLTRQYAALHEAPAAPITDSLGAGSWSGTYINPKIESRYNIDLEGSPALNLINRDRQMLDNLLPQKGQFASGDLTGPVVTVVRPPWHSTSYGLGLGVKLPTGQVQFTFNHDEAVQFCHWIADNIHANGMNNLHPMLYDSVTKSGPPCE